jgi:gas vesicle protein
MSHFTKRKALTYLIAIFLVGTACGAIIGYSSGKQQAASPTKQKEICDRTLKKLQTRLDLSDEQVAQIQPIVEQNSATMQTIQRESWQRVSDVVKRMNTQIAGYLTVDQKQKLEAMENQRCENVRKKCGTPRVESTDKSDTGRGK